MVHRIIHATLLNGGIKALGVFAILIAIQWRRLVRSDLRIDHCVSPGLENCPKIV